MELKMINLKKIVTNPLQPRQDFDRDKLNELANSIKEGELLQPIVVRPNNGGKTFEIVAGERRFKAFQILKEKRIPAIVRNISDDTDALEKSLIENLQRDNLTSVERENAIGSLWESNRYKNKAQLSRKLGYDEEGRRVGEILESYEFRKKTPATGVSTRTIIDTKPLPEESRKKVLKAVEEKRLDADKVRDVVRRVKEFPEPEQQKEIIELWEQKNEEDDELFEDTINKYKEIAKGEREAEIIVEKDPSEITKNIIKSQCEEILWITPAKINKIQNQKYRDETIEILVKTETHLNKLLKQLGRYGVVE